MSSWHTIQIFIIMLAPAYHVCANNVNMKSKDEILGDKTVLFNSSDWYKGKNDYIVPVTCFNELGPLRELRSAGNW